MKRRNGDLVPFPGKPLPPPVPYVLPRDVYPQAATKGDRIVRVERSASGFAVTFGRASTDGSGNFEFAVSRAHGVKTYKTEAGAATAVNEYLSGGSVPSPAPRGPFIERYTESPEQRAADRERARSTRAAAEERAHQVARYKVNDVVTFRGRTRRYVVTVIEPNYGGEQSYYLVALSGGEQGSAPSGVRESEITKAKDQGLRWEGVVGHKLKARYTSMGGLLASTPEKAKAAWTSARQAAAAAPVTIDPGVLLAQKIRYVFPTRAGHRGGRVSLPAKKKGVAWVTLRIEPMATYAKRLWEAYEALTTRGLTVNNVEAGLGRIIVVDDPAHALPPERVWEAFARASHMSGEKTNPAKNRRR